MASNSLICANRNPFNEYVLGKDAYYFSDKEEIAEIIRSCRKEDRENQIKLTNNIQKIEKLYRWDIIIEQYYNHMLEITGARILTTV
jgi:glycosyltransferase involved in cell wall biosynthesis